ncbi:MAG: hypothetical protein QNL61_02890 [Crocinitomicaceae bacterium]|mgnify:CR=1 FL=1
MRLALALEKTETNSKLLKMEEVWSGAETPQQGHHCHFQLSRVRRRISSEAQGLLQRQQLRNTALDFFCFFFLAMTAQLRRRFKKKEVHYYEIKKAAQLMHGFSIYFALILSKALISVQFCNL